MASLKQATYVKEQLPDTEPFRAWSNFEFIAGDGSINEIDLLVVSLYKVYLVESKSRPGRLRGAMGPWTWSPEGRDCVDDNPLLLEDFEAAARYGASVAEATSEPRQAYASAPPSRNGDSGT